MKLKTLLLLPFIITGCTGNNISSEEMPLTELPTLPSSKAPTSSSNDGSTSEETPLDTLPTAEDLNNLRHVKPTINNETMRDIVWLDFGFGRNVHIDADMTNPEILDEEHCPFVPEVYGIMNDQADTSFTSCNYSHINSSSFAGLCNEFAFHFYKDGASHYYNREIEEIAKKIKKAKIANYLGQFYKKTNYDKGITESKTYAILTDISSTSYSARRDIYSLRNYGFKDSYIEELKEVLEKDEFSGYYDLFEKYGTEYIYKVTYGPRYAMYVGFSGEVTFNTFGYDQKNLEKEISKVVDEKGHITLNDYSVTESEYKWGDEDWKGARQISYETWPFYNLLPEKYDLYKYSDRMDAAYKQYCEMKLRELEESANNLVEEQNYINDAYYKESGGEEVTNKKPFTFEFNFAQEDRMYKPRMMYTAGFTKLYMRPRIAISQETKYDAEIVIGGKRAKVNDGTWYQIDMNDIRETDSNVKFKITPSTKITAKVSLEFCYMK